MSDKDLAEIDEADIVNEEVRESVEKDQFLTFFMAGEEYGVDILAVQEIRGWDSATSIPKSPHYVKGVINLRGTIIPIVDLRLRFELKEKTYDATTVVIVLKVENQGKARVVGIVVDAVSDVYDIARQHHREAPSVGDSINKEFIKGLVNVNEKMVILLDLEKLLDLSELE